MFAPSFLCPESRRAAPPGSARPPPRAGAFATVPAELRWEGLRDKVPRTSVAAPTRRSDAALSWFWLNDGKGARGGHLPQRRTEGRALPGGGRAFEPESGPLDRFPPPKGGAVLTPAAHARLDSGPRGACGWRSFLSGPRIAAGAFGSNGSDHCSCWPLAKKPPSLNSSVDVSSSSPVALANIDSIMRNPIT